jgi:hypothetical protein
MLGNFLADAQLSPSEEWFSKWYSKRETAGSTSLFSKPEIEHNPERAS